ncbi:hypothetical protein BC332_27526 [Capsicum chinense]|nr:hypothetical protein BC332_27526 [Capsicum chinense]
MSAVVLNRFSGNPEDWIFQAERYFTYLGFPEKDWLPLSSLYLDDGGVMIIDRDATLLSRNAHRKYTWCFEFVVMKLSSLGAQTCLSVWFVGLNSLKLMNEQKIVIEFSVAMLIHSLTSSSTPTPCAIVLFATDNMVTWLGTKVIKILFLGHPKEEVKCYLAKDVAFSEHVLVGSSYSVWKIILFYGTWFQLFGLVAARRHFKSSSGTHTADLGRHNVVPELKQDNTKEKVYYGLSGYIAISWHHAVNSEYERIALKKMKIPSANRAANKNVIK